MGSLALERHADHTLIYSVALRPDARGKGFGRVLLDAAERFTASWGLGEIRLYTHQLMTRNQAIYTARGYREVGRRPHPKRAQFTIVDMVKPIVPAEAELRRLLDVMARLREPDGCPLGPGAGFRQHRALHDRGSLRSRRCHRAAGLGRVAGRVGRPAFSRWSTTPAWAEEAGRFAFADVARAITDKMIRRHPNVFAGSEAVAWEAHKAAERGAGGTLAGVPVALPALSRALKLAQRAARVGFDWPDASAVLDKLAEETAELRAELDAADPARLADEVGDMLFVLANLARKLGLNPETCLQDANAKFTRRFEGVEARLAAEGRTPAEAGLPAMEAAWNAVKRNEREKP